jgi:uncharacterized protein (DUF1499 family)
MLRQFHVQDIQEENVKTKMISGFFMAACFLFLSCSATRPSNLGIKDGRLSPCPNSSNCVSTYSKDKRHAIKPITYSFTRDQARERLLQILSSLKNARVVVNENDYIHVEFTSRVFRFVDDVEFYFDDEEKMIHFRSASRVGSSDLGVNRRRMEYIRTKFYE